MTNAAAPATIAVWHANEPTFGWDLSDRGRPAPVWPRDYTHVADVSTAWREDAYELTQHVYQSWTKNNDVTMRTQAGVRSTAVGDVLVTPDGYAWMVGHIGFNPIVDGAPALDVRWQAVAR